VPVSDRLIIFSMVVWGLTNVVSGSSLVAPIRDWLSSRKSTTFLGKLANCYMCSSFWLGTLVSSLGYGVCNELRKMYDGDWCDSVPEVQQGWLVVDTVMDGFIASGTTWIIFVVLVKLGSEEL
jgi:hypothetical protein